MDIYNSDPELFYFENIMGGIPYLQKIYVIITNNIIIISLEYFINYKTY